MSTTTSDLSTAESPGADIQRWVSATYLLPLLRVRVSLPGFLQVVIGLLLAVVWLRSSTAHLANPYYFLSSVYRYELVGPTAGRLVAMVLPVLQLFLAVCLVGRLFVGGALLASSVLLSVFLFVQVSVALRGLNISCGCFGAAIDSNIGYQSITNVSILLAVTVIGYGCWLIQNRRIKTTN